MSDEPKTGKVHASVITSGPAFENPYSRTVRVEKGEVATQLSKADESGVEWMQCPVDRPGLADLVDGSTILPQCIEAYASNIAGFGIAARYIDDTQDPSEEAERELAAMGSLLESLCMEYDTKQLFEHVIEAREIYGCSYVEVMRDAKGRVVGIDFIEDTDTILRSVKDDDYTTVTTFRRGVPVTYDRKFCRYMQQIGGKTIYYKEFGDPRVLSRTAGRYEDDGFDVPANDEANEILQFAIGAQPYGEIRWRGCILGIDGAFRAESLNNNYFVNGRHTPLLILINGGMLDEESQASLQHYMNAIKGEAGQHAFIVLCTESTGEVVAGQERQEAPKVELKSLADMLQQDGLFSDYIDVKRKQVQSAFLLPDLYVGYTTEFNRATAQTAKQVTEEQVFQGERAALAWTINNKLLADYGFKYVEAYFKAPDLTDPDNLQKLLAVCANAGGLTPNKAREIIAEQLGDQPEPYDADWADVPLQISRGSAMQGGTGMTNTLELSRQLDMQIAKADDAGENEQVIDVLKSVRSLLGEMIDEETGA